jgi:hypothetical protein
MDLNGLSPLHEPGKPSLDARMSSFSVDDETSGSALKELLDALQLIDTVKGSVHASQYPSKEQKDLRSQLLYLEEPLSRWSVNKLEQLRSHEITAFRQLVEQCQTAINGFLEQIQKFQPTLKSETSSKNAEDMWKKIEWNLCQKDNLVMLGDLVMAQGKGIEALLQMAEV